MLSLIAIFLSLITYWSVKEFGVYIESRLDKLSGNLKKQTVLGTEKEVDYNTLVKGYEKENQTLKENTLKFSPTGKKSAYFRHKFIIDLKGMDDRDYTSVIINDNGIEGTVFQRDDRLSSLDWLNEEEMVVYRDCGTECMQAYIVDIKTKILRDISIGVGYTWSPDKNYVLVYHYSWQYGISLANKGDKFGRTIFQLRRDQPPNGSGLANKTQAVWSPDSSKLALIIRKEKEEKLELLVFAVNNNFKPLLQKDLEGNEFSELHWADVKILSYLVNGIIIEEKI